MKTDNFGDMDRSFGLSPLRFYERNIDKYLTLHYFSFLSWVWHCHDGLILPSSNLFSWKPIVSISLFYVYSLSEKLWIFCLVCKIPLIKSMCIAYAWPCVMDQCCLYAFANTYCILFCVSFQAIVFFINRVSFLNETEHCDISWIFGSFNWAELKL